MVRLHQLSLLGVAALPATLAINSASAEVASQIENNQFAEAEDTDGDHVTLMQSSETKSRQPEEAEQEKK